MHDRSDARLLRDYAEHGAETAFNELVARHTNLVYSAALRQTDSPDDAAEVTQNVFIALARGATGLSPRLADDASLAGWLCRSARNLSLNLRRDAFRRLSRERQAMEQLDPTPETTPDWERLRPVIDEAMAELNEPDYDALVLRFFNHQDLRSVGRALGVSDDTAQKRVSRALDRLREVLSRRGIKASAAALSVTLSANAVQAAPAALALAVTTAVPVAATAFTTTTTAIAMTTLQKTLIAVTLAASVGTGLYEAREAASLRTEVKELRQQRDSAPAPDAAYRADNADTDLVDRLAALEAENAQLRQSAADVLRLRGEVARLKTTSALVPDLTGDAGIDATMKILAARANLVKQRLEQMPDQRIPELALLKDAHWFDAVKAIDRLESDADFRRAFHELRRAAKGEFAMLVEKALPAYLQANGGQLPSDLAQLKPYFPTPVDEAILQRYGMLHTGRFSDLPPGEYLVGETAPPVDETYDTAYEINLNGSRTTNISQNAVEIAAMQYVEANHGLLPTDASQVAPYLKRPIDRAEIDKLINRIPPGVTTIDQLNAFKQTSRQPRR